LKAPDRAGVSEIPWHQDAYYAVIDAPAYNCWVAITRTTVENGTIVRAEVPPGEALLPHVWDPRLLFFRCEIDERSAVPVVLEPGQAFVYHGRVPHRSGRNVSGELRVANGEPFGDRVPILREGERGDALLAGYATGDRGGVDHAGHDGGEAPTPGARLVAELEARTPARAGEVRALLARYREERDDALLGRALAILPEDEEVRGDKVRARTRPEQLLDEYRILRADDPRSARLLLDRVLELDPSNVIASAELARLRSSAGR
jgi:hypothetical protein